MFKTPSLNRQDMEQVCKIERQEKGEGKRINSAQY